MNKPIQVILIMLSMLGASMTAVAYVHSTFVNKDMFQLIREDLKQIKTDVQYLIKRKSD